MKCKFFVLVWRFNCRVWEDNRFFFPAIDGVGKFVFYYWVFERVDLKKITGLFASKTLLNCLIIRDFFNSEF